MDNDERNQELANILEVGQTSVMVTALGGLAGLVGMKFVETFIVDAIPFQVGSVFGIPFLIYGYVLYRRFTYLMRAHMSKNTAKVE